MVQAEGVSEEENKVQAEDVSEEESMAQAEHEPDLSLEEAFAQIEEVLAHLETEEITLEQSFQEYNRGMKLLQHCNETIDRVEKKVLQMNEDGRLEDF